MKKIVALLKSESIKELFLYLIVGGLATIVEWAGFYFFCNILPVQYLLATTLAYIVSTFANWLLGRILVFRKPSKQSLAKEILSIYLVSIVGLLGNLAIMFVMVQLLSLDKMFSKIVATILVFAYNYLIRKFLIYKK